MYFLCVLHASVVRFDFSPGVRVRNVIAVDMGGTNIRAARVDEAGNILVRETVPTPAAAPVAVGLAALETAIAAVRDGSETALAVACPGPLDSVTGTINLPPQLPQWRDVPLARLLTERVGLPTRIVNDASAAALGEWTFGAGRGTRHLVYIIAGTGIGGGAVANGTLVEGRAGMAMEFGHTTVNPHGPVCGCGLRGCVEAYSAGAGIVQRAREAIARGEGAGIASLVGETSAITGEVVAQAADAGDGAAVHIIETAGEMLGVGVANLRHLFDCDMIAIGGGMTKMGTHYWGPFRAALAHHTLPTYMDIPAVFSALEDNAGLLGAASRALMND